MWTKGTVFTMEEIACLKLRSRKLLKGKNKIDKIISVFNMRVLFPVAIKYENEKDTLYCGLNH